MIREDKKEANSLFFYINQGLKSFVFLMNRIYLLILWAAQGDKANTRLLYAHTLTK